MDRYRLTELAERDLDAVIAHIAEHNPKAALAMFEKLLSAARRAGAMPFAGTARDDLRPGIRMKVVENYLLFYVVNKATKGVTVVRILHGSRDLRARLTDAPLK